MAPAIQKSGRLPDKNWKAHGRPLWKQQQLAFPKKE
jgi:hypothetical protein